MEKISIIIPVYNVEKYMKKCIESVINQTYKNIEIILVDDGSTDRSAHICDEYEKKDKRIVVIHKKNGGLADARNAGIVKASGKYLGFIDSDDYIENDMYEVLYNNIKKENADISMCGLISCYKDTDMEIYKNEKTNYYVFNDEEAIRNVLEGKNNSVWAVNKLYKKELFDNVRYPVGKYAEDAFVIIKILMQCEKVVFTTQKKYYYIRRNSSITTNGFNKKSYDFLEAQIKNRDLIEKKYPNLMDVAQFRVCLSYFSILDKMILANAKIDKSVVKDLRSNFKFILVNNNFAITRKIAMILLMLNVNLYKIVCKIFYKKERQLFD